MKYKLNGNTFRIVPENSMNSFWLGKIWGKHGGSVTFVQSTDDPKKISYYEIEVKELFKILIAP